jgi:endonuclease-3
VPANNKPEDTQMVLERIIPQKMQIIVNHLLVTFGKDICQPRKPLCYKCPIVELCPYEYKSLK